MYKFMEEIDVLISSMIDKRTTEERISASSIYVYRRYVEKFFELEMSLENKEHLKLQEIGARDINDFLVSLDLNGISEAQKLNYCNILCYFFEYTNHLRQTDLTISDINKPILVSKSLNILVEQDYVILRMKLLDFRNELSIDKRLLIAFGLFGGLARDTISRITYNSIIFNDGCYKLLLKDTFEKEQIILLNIELQLLLHEFSIKHNLEENSCAKIFDYNSNYLSTLVSNTLKQLLGEKMEYTLNDLNDTFIVKEILKGVDVVRIARDTNKSITTIDKHIKFCEENYGLFQ